MSQSFSDIANADFVRLAAHVPCTSFAGKTVLLTGATGFFGAWLLSLFDWMNRTQGTKTHVFSVSRRPEAFLDRHPHFRDVEWLHWIIGDVRDFNFPDVPFDFVLHAATDTSAAADRDPSLLFSTIVDGTQHVLACARQAQTRRILLVSSGAVYGVQPSNVTHVNENAMTAPSPLSVRNAYGEGKRAMEMLGTIYGHETGAEVVVARCFAFTGAGLPLDAHFAIGNFIRDALGRDKISIRGGGTAERSYLYAADLAIWLLRLLVSGAAGQAYNVGSDQAFSIAELARQVVATLAPDKQVVIEGKDDPNSGRNRYIPSIAKARGELGLDVWTSLTDAVALTAAYRP